MNVQFYAGTKVQTSRLIKTSTSLLSVIKRIQIMIKKLLGAAILVATLSSGAQAVTVGTTLSTDAPVTTDTQVTTTSHKMMKHNHQDMKMMHCKRSMHRAHGKCVSMMKMHKMKHHMMPKY